MYNFIAMSFLVRAIQINQSGGVIVDGKNLCGDTGYWVVINETTGEQTVWSDEEFRKSFEPADDSAAEYLNKAIKK